MESTINLVWTVFLTVIITAPITALCTYFITNKLSARSERKFLLKEENKNLEYFFETYKELANEMKDDITKPENKSIRELVVLDSHCIFNSKPGRVRFYYYTDKTPLVIDGIRYLIDLNYLEILKEDNILICRIKEHFLNKIRNYH
ncbi:hypothetical protein [Legionella israelensis]|uniref:Uncharacterized protein n=1 Tax=Legionella israelensis TaxID=454 RepID=A0A0W0V2P0_9GAMM|nr:hypothetical protein [Legionella israelensis]KTD14380.1 hypothetical protein Lisr_2608 [Legionella israelensis]QBS09803.1 hypothetical protein E4T55_07985 [Legionella israelensis]SCY10779.1 hypothetical protein SAMN02746069_01304 [Legionella israelensis DSM 19235]STX59354.1 Uncharacterised protein [Legionella israelensis]